MKYFAQKK